MSACGRGADSRMLCLLLLAQGVLQLASSPGPAAPISASCQEPGDGRSVRHAALRLLGHPELLEWRGVRRALLDALCCQLHPALRWEGMAQLRHVLHSLATRHTCFAPGCCLWCSCHVADPCE